MVRFLLVAAFASFAIGCAPPRWLEPSCRGLPEVRRLSGRELAIQLDTLSNEKLLDLVACNMATSHPPNLGFPDRFVTSRSSSIAPILLSRIEARNAGIVSMGYMGLLEDMVAQDSGALTPAQRESASQICLEMHPSYTNRRGQVHHYCTAFGDK
jgi:hypothetical protein